MPCTTFESTTGTRTLYLRLRTQQPDCVGAEWPADFRCRCVCGVGRRGAAAEAGGATGRAIGGKAAWVEPQHLTHTTNSTPGAG
jgi:hypothetical protein